MRLSLIHIYDAGRFEQLKNYGTFIDADSIDHAEYGAQILFEQGKIRDYTEDASEDTLLWNAVRYHSAYRIPDMPDERLSLIHIYSGYF